ncbi:MAG: hypothetical protein ABI693_16455 [Bryobacteraceae bacterium]
MSRRPRVTLSPKERRTTLTLPVDSLTEAHRIARSRKVKLSTVIAEALSDGLRLEATAERSEQLLANYQKAFSGFSEEELAILDGVIIEPAKKRSETRSSGPPSVSPVSVRWN